jgi:hypothetical protein
MFHETTQENWSTHTCPNYNLFYDKNIASMKGDLNMCQMFEIIIFNYGIELKKCSLVGWKLHGVINMFEANLHILWS